MDIEIGNALITLLATTEIKAMLDTFMVGSTTYHAIVQGKAIPVQFQDMNRILQVYRTSMLTAHDINAPLYTVNCRQATEVNADTLAKLVYNEINRAYNTYSGDSVYTQCTISESIYESENHWNTPVEVRIFSKR